MFVWVRGGICIPKSKSLRVFHAVMSSILRGGRGGDGIPHQLTYSSVNNTPRPRCATGEEDLLVIAGSGCSLIPIILLAGAYNSEHLHQQLCPWVSNLYNYPIISDLFARDLEDFSIVDVILSPQYLCEQLFSLLECLVVGRYMFSSVRWDTISR